MRSRGANATSRLTNAVTCAAAPPPAQPDDFTLTMEVSQKWWMPYWKTNFDVTARMDRSHHPLFELKKSSAMTGELPKLWTWGDSVRHLAHGLMKYDGQAGDFGLEVDWMRFSGPRSETEVETSGQRAGHPGPQSCRARRRDVDRIGHVAGSQLQRKTSSSRCSGLSESRRARPTVRTCPTALVRPLCACLGTAKAASKDHAARAQPKRSALGVSRGRATHRRLPPIPRPHNRSRMPVGKPTIV